MTDTYVIGATGKAVIIKDPDAVLDYIFDWTLWLDDVVDTIASQTVTTPAGTGNIVIDDSDIVGKTVVAYISGGTVGQTYPVTCQIVTAASPARTDERTIYIKIKER
jgi:hypothetical protein